MDGCKKIRAGLLTQMIDSVRVFEDRLEVEWKLLQENSLREYRLVIPTGQYFADARIIKKRKRESIPDILKKEPFFTNKELAERLDTPCSTVRRWVSDYKKKGILYFDRVGGKGQWRVRGYTRCL